MRKLSLFQQNLSAEIERLRDTIDTHRNEYKDNEVFKVCDRTTQALTEDSRSWFASFFQLEMFLKLQHIHQRLIEYRPATEVVIVMSQMADILDRIDPAERGRFDSEYLESLEVELRSDEVEVSKIARSKIVAVKRVIDDRIASTLLLACTIKYLVVALSIIAVVLLASVTAFSSDNQFNPVQAIIVGALGATLSALLAIRSWENIQGPPLTRMILSLSQPVIGAIAGLVGFYLVDSRVISIVPGPGALLFCLVLGFSDILLVRMLNAVATTVEKSVGDATGQGPSTGKRAPR